MGHYREKKQNLYNCTFIGRNPTVCHCSRQSCSTSTKQTFVTTGIDLLETCQAAFLNINERQCQTTTLKVPRPLHCIRFLTFLRANSLNHPSGSLYNHNSLTSRSEEHTSA